LSSLRLLQPLTLFLCLICSSIVFALPSQIKQPRLRHISTTHGLIQNSVNSFYQDQQGFIWLSTDGGINRFDGDNFNALSDVIPGYETLSANGVSQDLHGNLWIATSEGLVFVNSEQRINHLSRFPASEKQLANANRVLGIEQIAQDDYWVVTAGGIYGYHLNNRDVSLPQSMSIFQSGKLRIRSYKLDRNKFWIGTNDGLYQFEFENQEFKKIPLQKTSTHWDIRRLETLADHRLIIGGEFGLFQLDLDNLDSIKSQQLSSVAITGLTTSTSLATNSITTTSTSTASATAVSNENSTSYYSTTNGIYSLDHNSLKTSHLFELSQALPSYGDFTISDIFIDNQNQLWIGTRNHGALIWNTGDQFFELWQSNSAENALKATHENILSISKNKEGVYWVGTETGLNIFDSNNKVTSRVNIEPDENSTTTNRRVNDLLQINQLLWIATANGLIQYNLKEKVATVLRPEFLTRETSFNITSLAYGSDNLLWLATNVGLLKFNIANQTFSYEKTVMSMASAKQSLRVNINENVVVTDLENEIIAFNTKSKKKSVLLKTGLDAEGNYFLLTDIKFFDDKLWLAFQGDGLYLLDGINSKTKTTIVKHFHTRTGFPDNQIFSIDQSNGFIWVTSAQGLIQIEPSSGNHVLISYHEGLPSSQFNAGSSLHSDNGRLMLGTQNGLLQIDTKEFYNEDSLPTPRITQIRTTSDDSSTLPWLWQQQTIVVHNSRDILRIGLSALDYSQPKVRNFEYWIDGQQKSLTKTTQQKEILLTGLPRGINRLNIRTRSADGRRTSKTIQLDINVVEAPWFTVPQTLGNYLLLLVVVVWIIYRRYLSGLKSKRLYQKLKQSEERMELALSDDRRGIWDCFIDRDNFENSSFIIYQNKQQPLKLTLDQYFTIVHPDDLQHARKQWELFVLGESASFFETYRSFFYQRWIWNRIYGKVNAFYKNGRPKRATGIWTDINQERKIEDKLNLYSHAFQSTQDIVFILDQQLNVIVVNQAYDNATGFSSDDLIGKNMLEIAFSRFTEEQANAIHQQLKTEKQWHGESSVPRKNAPSFPVDIKANIITKNRVETGYVVVMSDISRLRDSSYKQLETSFYDQGSGLPNKSLAFDRLRQLIKQCKINEQTLSVIFLSLDHFEKFTDLLDTDSVNNLISMICNRLLPYIQKDDVLARYEQDTFLIIIRHFEEENNVQYTINQLLREISKTFIINQKSINISACAGIASFPNDSANWSELVTKAETALAQTKQQGENLFKYYHDGSNQKALERVNIENKLARAISENELFLVFQPLIDLKNKKTVELDINSRWRTDGERIIYPSQFLRIADEIDMLNEISNWFVEKSLSALRLWNQEGLDVLINLNLRVSYLLDSKTLDFIQEKLTLNQVNSNQVFIAIHEDDIGDRISALCEVAIELNKMGLGLVLDDFGKSSASLQNLQKLAFHSIKLDRTLVRKIAKNRFNDRVLKGIISLVNDLKISSVAKGIETEEQFEFLLENKCRYGQGFLFSDPLNENQIRQYLLDS